MRKQEANQEEQDPDLIKSFVRIQDLKECYEAWVPYSYQGITGFIDLVLETKNGKSIFKFLRNAENLKRGVKSLKLEAMCYSRSQGLEKEEIDAYLMIKDNQRNRKAVFTQYNLLSNQPFEILFMDPADESIESIGEMKENVPKLFQTRKMRLEKDALRKLISKPHHERIQRAIFNCENSPDVVTEELVEEMDKYLERNYTPPNNITTLEKNFMEDQSDEVRENYEDKKIKNTKITN